SLTTGSPTRCCARRSPSRRRRQNRRSRSCSPICRRPAKPFSKHQIKIPVWPTTSTDRGLRNGTPMPESTTTKADELQVLGELERKILWLASWMIHNANHLRENSDGLKVGGHQASSASLATIMTALYLNVLRPQDRVAVKPHASPIFHAIQYLLGKQTRERLEAFRGYKGAQSYPSRTKDADDVDFSTGSVGLGVAQTLFSSLTQDYVRAHGWGLDRPEGRMVALVGDAELDEGNIFEALLEGWKQGLR